MNIQLISAAERQIVLDTETTGMNQGVGPHYDGHKIIEIGAVEVINRRLTGNHFHVYINPQRTVDDGAFAVHGISDEFLADKPLFKDIADDFIKFIDGAELVIHNAPFDVGFINHEFRLIKSNFVVSEHCAILDTLLLARRLFPGKRNNLDSLAERYLIDNSHRTLHGALLDAEILADVYLAMTGGQTSLSFSSEEQENQEKAQKNHFVQKLQREIQNLRIIRASDIEQQSHEETLQMIDKKSKNKTRWRL